MATQISNSFGIEFVDDNEVPNAPRKSSRNDLLWVAAAELLKTQPGTFARVKSFDSPTGAAQKCSQINNNKNKAFPSSEWEARYKADSEAGTSVLYLAYRADEDDASDNGAE